MLRRHNGETANVGRDRSKKREEQDKNDMSISKEGGSGPHGNGKLFSKTSKTSHSNSGAEKSIETPSGWYNDFFIPLFLAKYHLF
jgi:hypothetical protein